MPQLPQVSVQDAVKIPTPVAPATSTSVTSLPVQERSVSSVAPSSTASVAANQKENEPTVASGEDVAIFEQLRHQMLVWLRVEAVHCGLDISGLSPTQLLDALRQQGSSDETRLQIVSSLLNFADQVIKNGHASLLEYKQAMMFHLMHTRSGRPL